VAKSATGVERASGFTLVLLFATAVIELFVVAMASAGFDEVAEASPFGRSGTIVVAAVAAGIACLGAILAWRGVSGALRGITAILVFVAVGVTAVMVLFLVIAGGTPIILGVLLAHAAFSLGMIGRAVLRSAPTRTGR
jgi:hypothetical protein